MFIQPRKYTTKNKKINISYGLCQSVRENGMPRQKTLLNLGRNFDVPKSQWKELTHSVVSILKKQIVFPFYDEKFTTWRDYIVQRLKEINYDVYAPRDDRELIDLKNIKVVKTRTIGGERVSLEALRALGFERLLEAMDRFGKPEHRAIAIALVIGRMLSPGSELSTYDWLRRQSGLWELLGLDKTEPCLQTFYRVGDWLYEGREYLMDGLLGKAQQLFGFRPSIVFYDLSNTYYTGRIGSSELLRYGRSKEKQKHCPLVTLALLLDGSGFPREVRILPGNVSEPATLELFVAGYAKERPTIIMDAGIATEKNLTYLASKGLDWVSIERTLCPAVPDRKPDVSFVSATGNEHEVWELESKDKRRRVQVVSSARKVIGDRILKRRRDKLEQELSGLANGLQKPGRLKNYDKVVEKVGRIKEKHLLHYQYDIEVIEDEGTSNAKSLNWSYNKSYEEASKASGSYVLTTSHTDWQVEELVGKYHQLGDIERTFRSLKSELGLRPIYHQKDDRIEAHLFLSVLAYYGVHVIRTKLKEARIDDSWDTIRSELCTWMRQTSELPKTEQQSIMIEKETRWTDYQKEVAGLLRVKKGPYRQWRKNKMKMKV